MYLLRDVRAADLPLLAGIYRDAVLAQGEAGYSPLQVAVWAGFPERHAADFRAMIEQGHVRVACWRQQPVAFAALCPDDHLALLYVLVEHAGQGLATRLYAELEQVARRRGVARLTTDASLLSRPVFERCGFRVLEQQRVERDGQYFVRFVMSKQLDG